MTNKCLPPFSAPTLACTAMPRRDDDSEGAGGDWCRSSEQVVTSEPTCRHCELLAGDWCAHCGLPPWSVDHPRPIAEGAKRPKIKTQDAGPHDAGPAEPDRLHLEPVHWTTLASQDFHLRANWGKDCQDAGEEDDEEHLEHLESRQMHPNQGRIEARAPGEQADGRRAPLL